MVGVVLHDVAELGGGEGVLGGHVVAERGLVEVVNRGSGWGRRGGRGCCRRRRERGCGGGLSFLAWGRRWRRCGQVGGVGGGCCAGGRGCAGWGHVLHVGAHRLLLTLNVLHQLLETGEAGLHLVERIVHGLNLAGDLV